MVRTNIRQATRGRLLTALTAAALGLAVSLGARAQAQSCTGDCNNDCTVTIDELMRGAGIGLEVSDQSICPEFDSNSDNSTEINELIQGVDNALNGCQPQECTDANNVAATLTHNFGDITLAPHQEIASQCVSWTLNNDEPIYVSKITLSNGGAYHHSNWFVVPESLYPGPDGFFRCRDRGFDELASAVSGTVIFAQSTQSLAENQAFARGAVIKIPPRHKVVSGVHMLNLQNRTHETFLRMSLGLVHPSDVEVVLTPFRLSYLPLDIPPRSESRFTTECDLASLFEPVAKRPFDLKLYWVLPHYHELGSFFSAEVMGGPLDGHVIHSLDTFNAEPNGRALDPPLDLTGASGVRLTCGFYNPRDKSVGWGIGDQEMCVMLGLADSDILMDASGYEGNIVDGEVDGIVMNHTACVGLAIPRNANQTKPTQQEIDSALYVPPSLPDDHELPPVPDCVDTPDSALGEQPATLTSIRETVFRGSCTFSACHDLIAPQAGLDLASDDVRDNLLDHQIVFADTDLPLVAPGDPDGSWLMQLISQCQPSDDRGTILNHMPRNAPTLMPAELVAKVRDWILAGAQDN